MRLLNFEIWLVAGFIAASFFSVYFLPGAILAESCFCIVRLLSRNKISRRTPLDITIIVFLLSLVLSSIISPKDITTLVQFSRILAGIAFLYALVNWTNSRARIRVVYLGILGAGILLAISAIFSVNWAIGKLPLIPISWFSPFSQKVADVVNPNVLAGSMILILPVPIANVIFNRKNISKIEYIFTVILIIIFIFMVFLTQARGAWIALFFSLMFLFAMRWWWMWIILGGSIISTIAAWFFLRSSYFVYYFIGGIVGTFNNREEIWERAIFLIRSFPITGIGIGRYLETVKIFFPFLDSSGTPIPHAHNLFLQIGLDLGIPGLITWLACLITVTFISLKLIKLAKERQESQYLALGVAFICIQLALTIHGMIDSVTWGMVRSAPLVWALWGVAVAVLLEAQSNLPGKERTSILVADHPDRVFS